MKIKFFFLTFLMCLVMTAQKGTITGTVTDKDMNNAPLQFANVGLKGAGVGVTTDEKGKYSIKAEPGNYTLVFSFVGYETIEMPISLKAGETVTIDKALGSGSFKLDDVVIQKSVNREKESVLLLEQKKAVEIKQSIGAQEMSRKGVSDVEEGLTKITGISKVESRGLFVRGLEDRYNNLLINDLAAPTNNPYKKILPLDIFPTDIVGVIDVYKTFNPNIYGDFAGATFNIATSKDTKPLSKLSFGVGYTTNNSLSDFLMANDNTHSTAGFFGWNGSDRDIPSIFGSKATAKTLSGSEATQAFKSGFDVAKIKSPLNTSFGILHSEKFAFTNSKLSYLLSINFDNSYSIRKGVERIFNNNSTGFQYRYDFENSEFKYKTSTSALLGLSFNYKELKLNWNTFYIKTTENLIKDQFGYADLTTNTNKTLIRTNQLDRSDYINSQLLGEYALSKDKKSVLRGGASIALTKFGQPDRKFYSGVIDGTNVANSNTITTSIGGNNYIRQYLDIQGNYFFSGFAEYALKFGKDDRFKLTTGYNGNQTDMVSNYRFVSPVNATNNPTGVSFSLNSPDQQLNSYLANEAFKYRETSNSTYRARLNELTNTGYANLLYKAEKFEINGGGRLENYNRLTKYRRLGSFDDPYVKVKLNKMYFLPSLNVKYLLTDKANLRFAASQTYTKPVIMEAYPIEYVNPDGTSVRGNTYLTNSDNYNVDLKYELFPNSKELFVVGVFGKKIKNPIERTFITNAASSYITTFLNSDSAKLFGAEIEGIFSFEHLSKSLNNLSLGCNASLMQTQVDVKPYIINPDGSTTYSIETHKSRQLQGASKWIINADLKYQFNFSKEWSNTATLVYAVFGKRIYAVGTAGLDHVYELPFQQLNFIWNSKISKHFEAKLSVENILNPLQRRALGTDGTYSIVEPSTITNSYKRGVAFSTGISYTF